jgi:hypothetical protein
MRDFAVGHIAWGVTSQFPIFVSHHSVGKELEQVKVGELSRLYGSSSQPDNKSTAPDLEWVQWIERNVCWTERFLRTSLYVVCSWPTPVRWRCVGEVCSPAAGMSRAVRNIKISGKLESTSQFWDSGNTGNRSVR